MKSFIFLSSCVAGASAHGMISWPPPRNLNPFTGNDCMNNGVQACLWFNQGCQAGCDECYDSRRCGVGQTSPVPKPCCLAKSLAIGAPTLGLATVFPDEMLTWTSVYDDFSSFNPGRNPGFAPVMDSCGIAGGGRTPGLPGNGGYAPITHPQGFLGSDLPMRNDVHTVWKIGEKAEVAWDITANHGGAYQYRICSLEEFNAGGGEACFQRTPLDFARDIKTGEHVSWIQFGSDPQNRTSFKATRKLCEERSRLKKQACAPVGSTWSKNPISACSGVFGGSAASGTCAKKRGAKFTPLFQDDPRFAASEFKGQDGLYGFGVGTCMIHVEPGMEDKVCSKEEESYWLELFDFNIVDQVIVPDVPPGEYVLSWRWDSEQTPQIWNGCSDITIEA